jgi:two-component system, sensor histidine kinase
MENMLRIASLFERAIHDLRQPLAALQIYLDLFQHSHDVASMHKAVLGSMGNCIEEANTLLSKMHDITRLEWGLVTPDLAEFAVAEVLDRVVSERATEARVKGLCLRFVPSSLLANTNRELFRGCVAHLVEYAVRRTERGSVLVGCRRRQGRIRVEIWDTSNSNRVRTFEDLSHSGNDATLSLTIVARTAALLGIQIHVRSPQGNGAAFSIELPRAQRQASSAAEGDNAPDVRPRLQVALVDDQPVICAAIALALEAFGHDVVAAKGGSELCAALEARGWQPDIVLSDYHLARGETGHDVITKLRSTFGDDLPAIIMTGDEDPGLIRDMAEHGIVVLHKPVDTETLQAEMDALVWPNEAVAG